MTVAIGDSLRQTLPRYVLDNVTEKVARHRETLLAVKSREEWEKRRCEVERFVLASIGGYPQSCPLNPRTVAVHERDGYRIENVLVDSMPGFELNINLYIPHGLAAPAPAILCPTGHGAKTEKHYQEQAQGICRMGYIALVHDCIGRGERFPGNEHFDVGSQCLMLGQNLMRYFLWDNRRALDYLLTRPDVSADRIGCTGTSGGGRTTIFHAALDPRIACAVPLCCQLSVLEQVRLRYTGCPETYLWSFLAAGFDIPDLLAMIAPRPLLMVAASRDDINSIDIAEAALHAVRHIYSLYAAEDNISLAIVDDPHGYTKTMRLQMYDWMNRRLNHEPSLPAEPPLPLEEPQTLNCGISHAATVQTMNAAAAAKLAEQRKPLADYAGPARQVLALDAARGAEVGGGAGRTLCSKTTPLHGYPRLEEYMVESEQGIAVSACRLVPAENAPNVLYLSESGCEAFYTDPLPAALREQGMAAIMLSVRGYGALKPWPSPWEYIGYCKSEWELTQGLCELGRTLVGQQVLDLQAVLDAVLPQDANVVLLSYGRLAPAALHLAAVDSRVSALGLADCLCSLSNLAGANRNQWGYSAALPSILKYYDLPDLLASLAPRPLLIVNPRAADFQVLEQATADRVYHRVMQAYGGNLADLQIETQVTSDRRREILVTWAAAVTQAAANRP